MTRFDIQLKLKPNLSLCSTQKTVCTIHDSLGRDKTMQFTYSILNTTK